MNAIEYQQMDKSNIHVELNVDLREHRRLKSEFLKQKLRYMFKYLCWIYQTRNFDYLDITFENRIF